MLNDNINSSQCIDIIDDMLNNIKKDFENDDKKVVFYSNFFSLIKTKLRMLDEFSNSYNDILNVIQEQLIPAKDDYSLGKNCSFNVVSSLISNELIRINNKEYIT